MLYIHIPFCGRKCSYCGFYSRVGDSENTRQAYVDALCEEIRLRADELWDWRHQVQTVYFGGGTPTLLTIAQFEQILERLHRSFNLSEVVECTVEANPENLTPQYILALRRMGFFNRISIGVQSFDDTELRRLNRRHSGEQAREALRQVRNMGFRNISVDLIYGIPGQTKDGWLANLDECARMEIQHLSCYALTVENGTILERQIATGRVTMPSEEEVVSQYKALLEWCRQNGFTQYEISNFCREPYRSRHNRRYWDRTPYMGFGAAAHSFDGQRRRWNVADIGRYIEGVHNSGNRLSEYRDKENTYFETETLTDKDAFNEYVMTALRTTDGIDKSRIDSHFSAHLQQGIQKFIKAGYIEDLGGFSDSCQTTNGCEPTGGDESQRESNERGFYRPTEEGLLHADGMSAELFVD